MSSPLLLILFLIIARAFFMEESDYIVIDQTPEPTKAPSLKKDNYKDMKIDKYSSAYQYAKRLKTRYRC